MTQPPQRVLLVDDDGLVCAFVRDVLEAEGYQVVEARTLAEATRLIDLGETYEVVLVDRHLPDGDGFGILTALRSCTHLRDAAAIMISSDAGSEAIARGIRDGAQYFLAKPVEPAMLLAVVSASLQAAAEARRARDALPQTALALGLLRQARFTIRTFDDCRLLARALAPLCPRADGAVLALQELMFNAVEHGNLGIDYATKSALLLADRYHDELERRLGDPVLGRRRASVDLQRDDTGVRIHITDEGDGFAWEPYLELSAERMFDAHGRGIPMARLSGVDRLDYLGKGNEVLLQWERRPDDQV